MIEKIFIIVTFKIIEKGTKHIMARKIVHINEDVDNMGSLKL